MEFVNRLVKEGLDKKEIFKRACDEGLNKIRVARLLASFPDPEESQKYTKANKMLIGIYAILVMLGLLTFVSLLAGQASGAVIGLLIFAIAIPSIVVYFLVKQHSIAYLMISVLLFQGILRAAGNTETFTMSTLLGIGFNFALIIFALILKAKLFPYQNLLNTRKNSEGIPVFTKNMDEPAVESKTD